MQIVQYLKDKFNPLGLWEKEFCLELSSYHMCLCAHRMEFAWHG